MLLYLNLYLFTHKYKKILLCSKEANNDEDSVIFPFPQEFREKRSPYSAPLHSALLAS